MKDSLIFPRPHAASVPGRRFSRLKAAFPLDARARLGVLLGVLLGASLAGAQESPDAAAAFGAVAKGDATKISSLLQKERGLLKATDKAGYTLLHRAAIRFNQELVETLLKAGADVNAAAPDGATPLHLAAQSGDAETAGLLLEKGAKLDARDVNGGTPLHLAVPSANRPVAALLIEKGADLNARNKRGDTVLHLAMQLQDSAVQTLLIEKGANVNVPDRFGISPLLQTVLSGNREVLDLIRQRGAKGDALAEAFAATARDDADALQQACTANACLLNARLATGATLLHAAALWGAQRSAAWLLDKGLDASAPDAQAQTPLHWAARSPLESRDGMTAVARLLLARRAKATAPDNAPKGVPGAVDAPDVRGDAPLHLAAASGNKDLMALLLDNGAEINARDDFGNTPLARGAAAGQVEIVALLLDKGAAINTRNASGQTPLTQALRQSREKSAGLLRQRGGKE